MINVDNKIKNIYYMLCYSFFGERLSEKEEASLGEEAFSNIYDLFSLLLCLMLRKQIKKGIHKDYNSLTNEVYTVRGKIDIANSMYSFNTNKRLVCNYDEFNENTLLNQIIKTTIHYLIKSNEICNKTKVSIKKLGLYYANVDLKDIRDINWDQVKFNRNNISYKYIIDLCRLILKGLIVIDKNGNNKFKEFLDDSRVSLIYENFIKAYFRKHYPELKASSRRFKLVNNNEKYAPIMKTDIVLEYNKKMLIIDAKFYSKILKDGVYDQRCKILSSNNLFQIYTYVDSQDPMKEGKTYGMLLYAQTVNEPSIDLSYDIIGHKILVKTIDMNSTWDNIKTILDNIAMSFKNNN